MGTVERDGDPRLRRPLPAVRSHRSRRPPPRQPGVPGLPALRARHADGVRLGNAREPAHARGRRARRPGGPSGRAVRRAGRAALAGVDGVSWPAVRDTYLTNAVKHFKFETRGKLRLHKKPSAGEVAACAPWLHAELEAVRPRLVVALGATAGQALLGSSLRVTRDRGSVFGGPGGVRVLATVHPSSILRARDRDARTGATEQFVEDLKAARRLVEG